MQRRRIGRGDRGGEEREKGAKTGRKRKEEGGGHEGKLEEQEEEPELSFFVDCRSQRGNLATQQRHRTAQFLQHLVNYQLGKWSILQVWKRKLLFSPRAECEPTTYYYNGRLDISYSSRAIRAISQLSRSSL